jgi:hypothetical protein
VDVPVCASAGAAQQQRAASAATERNVIATSRGVVHAHQCAAPSGPQLAGRAPSGAPPAR